MTPGTATAVTPTAKPMNPAETRSVSSPGDSPAAGAEAGAGGAVCGPTAPPPEQEKASAATMMSTAASTTPASGPWRSIAAETRSGPIVTAARNSAERSA